MYMLNATGKVIRVWSNDPSEGGKKPYTIVTLVSSKYIPSQGGEGKYIDQFLTVAGFDKTAEALGKLKDQIGSFIGVVGEAEAELYKPKDGEPRASLKVNVSRWWKIAPAVPKAAEADTASDGDDTVAEPAGDEDPFN
jgi:single-stranded DNA-binding protein